MEKKVPHVLQYPADYGGCGFWRLLWPQVLLNMKGNITVQHSKFYIRDFLHYANVNAVHIQRQLVEHQLQFFRKLYDLKKRLPFRLIYDIDDIFFYEDIPEYNSAKEKVKNNQLP